MVKVLRLKKELAQTAKEFLLQKGWLATGMTMGRSVQRYVLLPLNDKFDEKVLKKKFEKSSIENRNLKPLPPMPGNLKHMLQGLISEKDIEYVIKSYDTVGDICILEILPKLEKYELVIAHAIKRAFPSIKVIARKAGERGDIFRVMPLRIITGEKRLHTVYKEHGVLMNVDLAKVYFSPRASHERLRLAYLVKKNEKVLVMFGGVAPYALVIAKYQPNCRVWTVELNEDAHKLAEENIRLNRAGHIVTAILGDVTTEVPKIGERFDRIIMPFPEKAWEFLPLAVKYAAPNSTIHIVLFVKDSAIEEAKKNILNVAKKAGRDAKIAGWRLFGSYAPRTSRYTFDVLVK